MSVGEALVHGLLGGTVAASEHYVTDWRDKVKRARDEEDRKREREYQTGERKAGQKYQTSERIASQTYQTKENKAQRAHQIAERLAEQTFQAGENKLTREQQTQERISSQEFTSSERNQDVIRKQKAYEDTLALDKKYRELGTQYTWDATGENLVPVQPGKTAFAPPVAEMDKDGKFQWYGTGTGSGTKRKGLLTSKSGSTSTSASKASDQWADVELPSTGPLGGTETRSIYIDPTTNKQYQVAPNGQGGIMLIPFETMQEAPVFVSPEQQVMANQFAEKTVNDLAGTFSTDATDFADWGGSREAAKEYFRQNYLQGTQLDESGRLRLPTTTAATPQAQPTPQQAPAQNPVVQTNDRTDAFIKMYDSLNVNQQDILQQAIKAIQVDKRDPALVRQRLLDNGFTAEQLSYLF